MPTLKEALDSYNELNRTDRAFTDARIKREILAEARKHGSEEVWDLGYTKARNIIFKKYGLNPAKWIDHLDNYNKGGGFPSK